MKSASESRCIPCAFAGNVYFEGLPAWSEHDLTGREIEIGTVRLKVVKPTTRCAATEVNPETAIRDLPIPKILMDLNGNINLGIYAEVTAAGKAGRRRRLEDSALNYSPGALPPGAGTGASVCG